MDIRNYLKYNIWHWKIKPIISYIMYDIPRGIRNLIIYAPIIWRTREWDYIFLYEFIAFKLSKMEPVLRNGYHTKAEQTADRVKIAKICMERLTKEYWTTEAIIATHETEKIRWLARHEEYLQNQDLKLFSKYMAKYSRGWWD